VTSLHRKLLVAAGLLLTPVGLVHAGRTGSFEPPAAPALPTPAATGADAADPAVALPGVGEDEALAPPGGEGPDEGAGAVGQVAAAEGGTADNPFSGPDGVAVRRRAPPLDAKAPLAAKHDLVGRARPGPDGRLQVKTEAGVRTLTLDPVLQRQLGHVMASYRTPHAAAVVLEPSTGRVLAMAGHAENDPDGHALAVRAAYPAASVFKLITASALVRRGLGPTTQECYDGGLRRVSKSELRRPGSSCVTLASAMGLSTNVVFAKLAHQHLTPQLLAEEAALFGFNAPIPFDQPVEISPAVIPEGAFAFAETGAGFGDVYLSPLHGALLAATVANGGRWVDPSLFEPLAPAPGSEAPPAQVPAPLESGRLEVVAEGGPAEPLPEALAAPAGGGGPRPASQSSSLSAGADLDAMAAALQAVRAVAEEGAPGGAAAAPAGGGGRQIMDPDHAAALAEMLEMTVTQGTARRIFAERGFAVPDAVGKTGTLADNKPFRDYSWFVGYAPKDNPKVAVAVVIVNDPIWRIRATWLAREAMRLSLKRLEGEVGSVVSAAPTPVPALAPRPLP